MQPTFLPWQGYFALIGMSDIFVFLDDAQFVRQSFHHRNRLFAARARVDWISLPVAHAGLPVSLLDARAKFNESGRPEVRSEN